mmetsp:Transcript_19791/g.43256  ORF Transcript_19791/g.43256 Transcript_19791/m.43256 type:complete len:341 (-) Transcript_19791:75-1097(-)
MVESPVDAGSAKTSSAWCLFYSVGIIFMLVVYGLLQERIMSVPYGSAGEMFTDSVFLVLCNRIVAVIFGLCMARGQGESLENKAPLWKYLAISVTNVYSSACQYEALRYLSFSVQMLGKSFKMMPVMLVGIFISGKRYNMTDWLIAAAVTVGVTEFLLTGPIDSTATTGNSPYGFLLLATFLLLDGFTANFQEKLFREHSTSKYNQMVYINLGSTVISLLGLIACGTLRSSVLFAGSHPEFVMDAGILSAAAVAGQWFIYSQIKEFGALVFVETLNVRQVVSLLTSYVVYGHSITVLQVLGLAVVFGALFYKSLSSLAATAVERQALLRRSTSAPGSSKA